MYPFCCVRLQHERADGTHRSVNVPIRQMKGTCHVSGLEDIVMRPLAMRAAGLSYLSWVPTAKGGLASCSGIGSPAKHMLAEVVAILTIQPGRRWRRTRAAANTWVEEDERPRNEAIGQGSGPSSPFGQRWCRFSRRSGRFKQSGCKGGFDRARQKPFKRYTEPVTPKRPLLAADKPRAMKINERLVQADLIEVLSLGGHAQRRVACDWQGR